MGFPSRCRATSGRTVITPLGHCGYPFVATGNLLAHRAILILLLLSAKHVRWLLEQPANSAFPDLPRWAWFLKRVTVTDQQEACHVFLCLPYRLTTAAKVYRGYFYMGCFQGQTMKRHVIWSNDFQFIRSIVDAGGFLSTAAKQALSGRALAVHKTDPITGQKKFTGVKKRLKDSQSLFRLTRDLHKHRNVEI